MDDETIIRERITRLRRLMLVHSAMYYRFGTSIVTDVQFDAWAYELCDLQRDNADVAASCPWSAEFAGWDGTTGYDLPTWWPWTLAAVERLLAYEKHVKTGVSS